MGKTFKDGHDFPAEFGFTGSSGTRVPVRTHVRATPQKRLPQPEGVPPGEPASPPTSSESSRFAPQAGSGVYSTLPGRAGIT